MPYTTRDWEWLVHPTSKNGDDRGMVYEILLPRFLL